MLYFLLFYTEWPKNSSGIQREVAAGAYYSFTDSEGMEG